MRTQKHAAVFIEYSVLCRRRHRFVSVRSPRNTMRPRSIERKQGLCSFLRSEEGFNDQNTMHRTVPFRTPGRRHACFARNRRVRSYRRTPIMSSHPNSIFSEPKHPNPEPITALRIAESQSSRDASAGPSDSLSTLTSSRSRPTAFRLNTNDNRGRSCRCSSSASRRCADAF